MTDKQIIIIEGCDVSEWTDEEILYKFKYRSPKDIRQIAFDLYKQLQAKNQKLTHFKKENERHLQTIVKDQAEIVKKNIDETNILLIKKNMDLQQQLQAKEQECEQKDKDVKFLIKCLDNSFKTLQDSELHWEREKKKLKAENEHLLEKEEEARHYLEEAAKFKNCLYEIREIVLLDKTSFKYAGSTISICDDILIKISEVENE